MGPPAPPPHAPKLRLRISPAAESAVRDGHPWIYDASVRHQNRPGQLGELAILYDRRNRFLALGLCDPTSPLRIRILHTGQPQTVDPAWWRQRLEHTLAQRQTLFDHTTNGYRLIHGESDGWPGLVLDRYAETFVVKLYAAAWLPRWPDLVTLFQSTLPPLLPQPHPCHLILRLSRNLHQLARENFQLVDGQVAAGHPPDLPQPFLESALHLEAETRRGQKTGFYLDQRENRRRIEALAPNRSVLNAFSFTGGFSIYAARGGATSVTDLDISEHALAGSRRHFLLNQSHPAIARCPHHLIQADAFDWLAQSGPPAFDLIVLDPPSLARRESERAGAIRAYDHLTTAAVRHLRPRGLLFAASCSAHVSSEEFFQTVRRAAHRSRRPFTELATTGHPPDHPATFPEAHYLKGIYLQFEPPSAAPA